MGAEIDVTCCRLVGRRDCDSVAVRRDLKRADRLVVRRKISPPNCPPTFVLVVLAFSGMCGRKRLILMVGATGLEPVTSCV